MIKQRNPSIDQLYKKFLDQGYYPEWAIRKAKTEYNSRLIDIPFTMPDKVDGDFDSTGD